MNDGDVATSDRQACLAPFAIRLQFGPDRATIVALMNEAAGL
jgi:hypothetical protein